MIKGLLAGASLAALMTGCASTGTFVPPTIQAEQARTARMDTSPLPTYARTDMENRYLLQSVFNRLRVAAQPICRDAGVDCSRFAIAYDPRDVKNAVATDGYKVTIYAGLMKHMPEEQVAAVTAHELSHHIAKHNIKTREHAGFGALAGGLLAGIAAIAGNASPQTAQIAIKAGQIAGMQTGVRMYSKDQEAEADYVAAYILRNAGYDLGEAGKVWSTLARISGQTQPGTSSFISTHPSNAERTAAWDATVREVHTSRTGLPKRHNGPN